MKGSLEKRIKVVVVINDFLIGGAQQVMIDVLKRLDRTRFDPSLLILFRFGESESDYLYDRVPTDVPAHTLHFRGVKDVGAWFKLFQLLRTLNPDVVLSNLFFSNTVIRILSLFFHYRTLIVEHNTYTKKPKTHQVIDRFLLPVTARIVAVSNTVARFTAQQEHIDPRKFVVIHNGIDIEKIRAECASADTEALRKELALTPEHKVVINVARVVPQKNQRLLVEGFAKFVSRHPEYRLLVVGGGSKLKETEAYAKTLGLAETVAFLGYRKDVPSLLAISDFFISTSLIEGFGIGHAEALVCGLPVLTTKTAGPDEMITEGVNGFFISDYTQEAVDEGLEKMHASDLVAMREECRRSGEQYSIERAVRAYEALFEETVMKN